MSFDSRDFHDRMLGQVHQYQSIHDQLFGPEAQAEMDELAEEVAERNEEEVRDRKAQLAEFAAVRQEAESTRAEAARLREEDQQAAAQQKVEERRRWRLTVGLSVAALLVSGGSFAYTALKPAPAPVVITVPAPPTP